MDTPAQLSRTTITLHWVIALAILGLTGLGIYMVQTESWPLFHTHKSLGLLIFALILVRVLRRLKHGLPRPVRAFSRREYLAANSAHYLLLAGSVAMPLTGMLYSASGGHGFGIFSVELFPSNYQAGQAVALNAQWSALGQGLHSYIGYGLLALVCLHVAGALKHHLLDRDGTLKRMLGATIK